ncbi:hypothetical protein V8Z74_17145 [Comamonas sp. w2-DMI]|uniref:hypothetical protein n=1 Tax=Comamonas sp. w2-DMI TaxID=3126391 RepID=UPI0032E3F2C4
MLNRTPTSPLSPPPGQQDQSACLAAPASVDQVEGTHVLEHFQRWLEDRAHDAAHATWPSPSLNETPSNHEFRCNAMIHSCREATALLMMFKLEQGL